MSDHIFTDNFTASDGASLADYGDWTEFSNPSKPANLNIYDGKVKLFHAEPHYYASYSCSGLLSINIEYDCDIKVQTYIPDNNIASACGISVKDNSGEDYFVLAHNLIDRGTNDFRRELWSYGDGDYVQIEIPKSEEVVWLRLQRIGPVTITSYSYDNINWVVVENESHISIFTTLTIGITSSTFIPSDCYCDSLQIGWDDPTPLVDIPSVNFISRADFDALTETTASMTVTLPPWTAETDYEIENE